MLLSKFEPVLQWTKRCDNVLYQGLVEILIPDVLRPIPSEWHPRAARPCSPLGQPLHSVCPPARSPPAGALTQAIRNFAKSLESWLTHAMVNIPEEMLRVKVRAGLSSAPTPHPGLAQRWLVYPNALPLRDGGAGWGGGVQEPES